MSYFDQSLMGRCVAAGPGTGKGAGVAAGRLRPPCRTRYSSPMDFKSPIAGRYVRIVAIIALLLGLSDAARLLGVTGGAAESPLVLLGPAGFTYLAIFAMARLFAAVGLWIRASWGAVLLVGATGIELGMYLIGSRDVQMSALGFAVRLVLLVSIILIFVLSLRFRERAHD